MSLRPARTAAYWIYHRLPRKLRAYLVRILTPNYTIGSVALVRDSTERLLLVRKPHEKGWSLPGGLINRRETPATAAARELAEEVGIQLVPEDLTPATPNALVNPRSQQVDLVFTATLDATEPALTADGDEIAETRWFNLTQLPPLTVATARLLACYGIGPYTRYLAVGAIDV